MDKAQLAEMLAELDPAELRVIRYEMSGGHTCSASTTLYNCCNEARCEACHVPHLKEMHDEAKLYAYEKFVNMYSLTWAGYVPTKQTKKVNKNTKRVRQESKVDSSIAADVSDDDLEQVLMLLAKKLGKQL